ncbi:MAG: hypothetical protein RX316_10445 [bacterium]|nr:hypothetical protein [bacterium]
MAGPSFIPDPISELTWDDVDSTVVEINADVVFYDIFLLSSGVGFGSISDGTFRDRDWNSFGFIISDTISDAESDDLLYFNIDTGIRMFQWEGPDQKRIGYIDFLIGYQQWRETFIATKTRDLFPGTRSIDQGKAITEEFKWDSMRVGLRVNFPLFYGLGLRGRSFVIPFTLFELEDIHHLRTDLKQDPSFETEAFGGVGYQLDYTLFYNFWEGLSVEVGYQIWDIVSGEDDIIAHSVTGTDATQPFNQAESFRHGILLGINYNF